MTGPSHAVFVSYASQDVEAARRICETLRAAAIEVWFDQSELRGGDAWDRQIRRQIRDCALFIPIISAHSQARLEGYFRREWRLAADRTYDMAPEKVFILPVVIDGTPEHAALVPDPFHELHWTRLPGGETPAAFVERIRRLLSSGSSEDAGCHVGAVPRAVADFGLAGRRGAGMYGLIAAAALLVLGYVGLGRLERSQPGAADTASIAVLPLTNESAEADQQYFSDGISEDLINALGQFPGLKVIGRISSFQFRDSRQDSRSIGAKLGVARLLEGSVQRSGDMVRVSTELIDTTDGSMLWSQHYDRPYKDLFALEDEITRAVAAAVKAKLLPGVHAQAQSERPPGGSLEAYNAMLQGRFYFSRDAQGDIQRAIEFYTQAIQADPRYALAWSGLSRAWSVLAGGFLQGAPAQQAYAKALEAADRAVALAPDLAAAHGARGTVLQFTLQWRPAEEEYRRALALAPDDADAQWDLGSLLATLGELQSALGLTRQALATEPLEAGIHYQLARLLLGLNRTDEAERAIRSALELQPGSVSFHALLAAIQVQRGEAQAALQSAQQEPPGSWRDIALALARQIGGDRIAADAALRTLIDKDAELAAYQIAEVYALRNDASGMFRWLDRAWSDRDPGIAYLLYDPFVLRYRNDPRFVAFCRKAGLPVRQQT